MQKLKDINRYKIAASLLDCDFLNLGNEIKKIDNLGIDVLHLDVMDGSFVKNISIGQPVIRQIRKFTGMFLDVHLMIKDPDRHLDSFIESGADLICVHAEECPHLSWTLSHIKQAGLKAAVALNPSTSVSVIENVLCYIDMALIMTVNPGFGGQEFLGEMVFKICKLKGLLQDYANYSHDYRSIDIQVDGGINPDTAPVAVKAGDNILVLGSAIFKSGNPGEIVKKVKDCLKEDSWL
jgi:ribulose-phosphate 3-epimerase